MSSKRKCENCDVNTGNIAPATYSVFCSLKCKDDFTGDIKDGVVCGRNNVVGNNVILSSGITYVNNKIGKGATISIGNK